MELPFEKLETDLLKIERFNLNKHIQDIKPVSQGNQVLKKIMIDLLELQFTLEDNVLLIKGLKCLLREKEKKDRILNTARQQITSIGSVNQLGTTWIQVSDNIESTLATVNSVNESCLTSDKKLPKLNIRMDMEETFIKLQEIKYPFKEDINFLKEERNPIGEGNPLPIEDTLSDKEAFNARGEKTPHAENINFKEKVCQNSLLDTPNPQVDGELLQQDLTFISLAKEQTCLINIKEEDNSKDADPLKDVYKNERASQKKLKPHNSRKLGNNDEGPKPCDECGSVSSNAKALRRHKRVKHDTTGGGKCEQCDFMGRNKRTLKTHVKNCHTGMQFMCDKCNYVGKSKSLLMTHVKGRHDNKIYMCDKCEYVTTWSARLLRHINFKHNGVNFPCDQCNYVGDSMTNLRYHKTTQHEPPTCFCNQCDYATTLPRFLQAHIENTHEKIRYPCNLCDQLSTSASNLRQHKRRVHKLKPEETHENLNPIKI